MADIIILPVIVRTYWDQMPSDGEPPINLNEVLAGRFRGKPHLIWENKRHVRRIITDDAFHGGDDDAA